MGLGLSKNEAEVYISLLELGQVGLTEIATKSKINRTSLYKVIKQLEEKKLIKVAIRGKRKVYFAEAPNELQKLAQDRLSLTEELLPTLLSLTSQSKVRPTLQYLEGIEGIIKAFRETLSSTDKVILAFSGIDVLAFKSKALLKFWEGEYANQRIKKGIKVRLIAPDGELGQQMKKRGEKELRETKLLPASSYQFESEIHVYDDIVAFISFSQGEEFAIRVKSKPLATTLKMIWRIVWNSA